MGARRRAIRLADRRRTIDCSSRATQAHAPDAPVRYGRRDAGIVGGHCRARLPPQARASTRCAAIWLAGRAGSSLRANRARSSRLRRRHRRASRRLATARPASGCSRRCRAGVVNGRLGAASSFEPVEWTRQLIRIEATRRGRSAASILRPARHGLPSQFGATSHDRASSRAQRRVGDHSAWTALRATARTRVATRAAQPCIAAIEQLRRTATACLRHRSRQLAAARRPQPQPR